VSVGKLRKLYDLLSEIHSSLCERRLEKTVLWPIVFSVKTVQFTQLTVRYDVTRIIAEFSSECIGLFMYAVLYFNEYGTL